MRHLHRSYNASVQHLHHVTGVALNGGIPNANQDPNRVVVLPGMSVGLAASSTGHSSQMATGATAAAAAAAGSASNSAAHQASRPMASFTLPRHNNQPREAAARGGAGAAPGAALSTPGANQQSGAAQRTLSAPAAGQQPAPAKADNAGQTGLTSVATPSNYLPTFSALNSHSAAPMSAFSFDGANVPMSALSTGEEFQFSPRMLSMEADDDGMGPSGDPFISDDMFSSFFTPGSSAHDQQQ